MVDTTPELAWDYTGDESSPLLQRSVSPHHRSDESCRLTHRQTQFLLHSLSESAQILHSARHQTNIQNNTTSRTNNETDSSDIVQHIKKWALGVYQLIGPYIALIAISLQVLAVIIETVWDGLDTHTTHRPVIQSIVSLVCLLLLLTVYVSLVYKVRDGCHLFLFWFSSFLSSLFVFSGFFTVFYRFSGDSLLIIDKPSSSTELYIVTYLRMLHLSVSILTLNTVSNITAISWQTMTVQSIEVLVGYTHIVLVVVILLRSIHPFSPSLPPPINDDSVMRQMREYDTDSLLYALPVTTSACLTTQHNTTSSTTIRPIPSNIQQQQDEEGQLISYSV